MARHLTTHDLSRLLSGIADSSEIQAAAAHLLACKECLQRSADLVSRREVKRLPSRDVDPLSAVLGILEREDARLLESLRARSWWVDLREKTLKEQRHRLAAKTELRTFSFFRTVLDEAARVAFADPLRGEQESLFARDIAAALPSVQYSDNLKWDLQGEALTVAANCRRLAADWKGAAATIIEAKESLLRGTADPLRQARLLSIHASLACDTGNLDAAIGLLSRAAANYRTEHDLDGLAGIVIQEAAIHLLAGRAEEAMARGKEVLSLASVDRRLEMIARSLITESLLSQGRAQEALRSYSQSRDLYVQFPDFELRVNYLEAKLLSAMDYGEESERLLRYVAEKNWEMEQYQEAFRTMYDVFETIYKRGEYAKAESLCKEVINLIKLAGNACHSQVAEVWEQIRMFTAHRVLTASKLSSARLYLIRHWCVPADQLPFDKEVGTTPGSITADLVTETLASSLESAKVQEQSWISQVEITHKPQDLSCGAYTDALDRYDRDLILAALAKCSSEIKPTARFLGISRNSLRFKMRKYNLRGTDLAS